MILALWEQGLGDTIQFSRLLPALKEKSGANVKFVCQDSLAPLLKGLPGLDAIIPDSKFSEKNESYDRFIPLLSLPERLGLTIENIPFKDYYIRAPAEKIEYWRPRVSALPAKKSGWLGRQ